MGHRSSSEVGRGARSQGWRIDRREAFVFCARCAFGCWAALWVWTASPLAATAQLTDDERIAVAERLRSSTVTIDAGDATGSGFVVGKEHWVITNAHVVADAVEQGVEVRFEGSPAVAGRVLGVDPDHDLVVLAVPGAARVPALPLGDSDAVRVGETVLAFGSPYGLAGTLTQGIVSARRDLDEMWAVPVRRVIQTDAPINPGNSGGPLVNRRGQVIGVNTAILSRGGSATGIGFAIPAAYVAQLLDDVRREPLSAGLSSLSRKASRAQASTQASIPVWLGVYGETFRAHGMAGVRLVKVVPGGPADRAGLVGAEQAPPAEIRRLGTPWTGHILLAIDDRPIRSMRELQALLAEHQPGDTAMATFTSGPGLRRGKARLQLLAAPGADVAAASEPPADVPAPWRAASSTRR